ncbi:uncharacterized protein LOC106051995 [Biomphalaria glabrata]|uniref:Uncharacterized protein LOC106051995 n=1 Tax=Biomphalaria glabrata TaxID=6526 RepID=A0A9U8DV35_BIOGL|nr:uncharacterized protein LOC106051995 [Biomphalaria glabrata]XP_013062685.2 uncharacterized protein LOC106051995 [Biomphalaria glabrata]XP_013062686.2 uncharacterized protein LOC106051995 [Biomphalaria glabrata]XP_055878417.1 uncharacterized protein LOC106051995 [Biomphalaria glabrata]
MYEQEFDTAPYDNVEFPVRKPGTGTWPGPASAASTGVSGAGSGSNVKLFGHQTTGRGVGGASKLAPLVEVDGSEGAENNHRMQLINFGSSQAATSSSTSTTSFTAQQHGAQSKTASTTASSLGTELNATPTTNTFSTAAASSTSTAASTATATTTTSSSSTSSSSAAARQSTTVNTTANTSKPVITVPNDSTTYVATQVTSTSDTLRKKTPKQMETEDEDFKRHDLNPWARSALERVYTQHKDFYQLNSKVLDEGSLLKQDVMDIYRKTGETLTYEQLLQGMLVDGERFLLGSCWLYFTHVQFLDVEGTRALREPYGKGRIGLTSKRALFLSTENYTDANLEQFVDASKKQDNLGYKLEVSKRSIVLFKNIPLSNFHSAEMEVVTGTAAQTKITKNICCGCFGIGKWVSTPPMTRSINNRVLRVGVSMPPWQTRMFLDIHLDPSMSLTVARDFISQLHAFAPHMH